jgi:Cysteine-rich secretory protein family
MKKNILLILALVSGLLTGCNGGGTATKTPNVISCTAERTFFDEVFNLTNAERQKAGLMALTLSTELIRAAQSHTNDMATNNYFSHTGLNQSTPGDRATGFGYGSSYVGENIGAGYNNPLEAIQGWMNSPGHKANILNSTYTEIGVGFSENSASTYGNYWAQVFGDRPTSSKTTAPDSALPQGFCTEIQKDQTVAINDWDTNAQLVSGPNIKPAHRVSSVSSVSTPEPNVMASLVLVGIGLSSLKRNPSES